MFHVSNLSVSCRSWWLCVISTSRTSFTVISNLRTFCWRLQTHFLRYSCVRVRLRVWVRCCQHVVKARGINLYTLIFFCVNKKQAKAFLFFLMKASNSQSLGWLISRQMKMLLFWYFFLFWNSEEWEGVMHHVNRITLSGKHHANRPRESRRCPCDH